MADLGVVILHAFLARRSFRNRESCVYSQERAESQTKYRLIVLGYQNVCRRLIPFLQMNQPSYALTNRQ